MHIDLMAIHHAIVDELDVTDEQLEINLITHGKVSIRFSLYNHHHVELPCDKMVGMTPNYLRYFVIDSMRRLMQ